MQREAEGPGKGEAAGGAQAAEGKIMTLVQAAECLEASYSTVYRLVTDGEPRDKGVIAPVARKTAQGYRRPDRSNYGHVAQRRFGNTLRDSVFQRILWAIEVLGLESVFKSRVSPMEAVYTPTGQRIVFRGADGPLKLEGVKFTRGYAAVAWLEEVGQPEGLDAVRSILNGLRRGGDRFWIFYSCNPPKTVWPWVNAELLGRKRREGALVRGSSHLDAIDSRPEWLGAPFIEGAECLRDTNEAAWRWEHLGGIAGTGGAVFDSVRDARLPDSRIRGFERVRNGVGWGWLPDPRRFVRCAWEQSARRPLVFEEHSASKVMPADAGQIAVDSLACAGEEGGGPCFHDQVVYCDDAPGSKVQMPTCRRDLGIGIHAAREAGMRRLSYEWLAGLREIAIDSKRCPLTFAEFTLKELERGREGNWVDEIPDGSDHSIDAVRYACMDDALRGA